MSVFHALTNESTPTVKCSIMLLAVAATFRILSPVALSNETQAKENRQCKIAILRHDLPSSDGHCVRSLVEQLRQDGFHATELSAAQVCDKNELSSDKFFLYIIPNCRTYPAAGLEALIAYTQRRGHVLFLGGPFLDAPIWQGKDGWLQKAAILAIKQNVQPTHSPFPQKTLHRAGWNRATNDPANPGSWEMVPEGPQGEACFRFTTKNFRLFARISG